nr:MAG TPA: hypothetical protein [Caudoviricetes sp.]
MRLKSSHIIVDYVATVYHLIHPSTFISEDSDLYRFNL